jgi:hypothetical protein
MKLMVYTEIRGNGLEAVETLRRRWLLQVCAFALRAFEVEISKASRDICPYLVCVDLGRRVRLIFQAESVESRCIVHNSNGRK